MPSALLPPLIAAIEPIAAYVNRTPAGNKHADHCADLINAASEYVEAQEAADQARDAAPDWRAIAERAVSRLEIPGYQPTALIARCQRFLALPRVQRTAALTLGQRMYCAQINSHYLGPPDYLFHDEPDSEN